jgi:hypothetical protein
MVVLVEDAALTKGTEPAKHVFLGGFGILVFGKFTYSCQELVVGDWQFFLIQKRNRNHTSCIQLGSKRGDRHSRHRDCMNGLLELWAKICQSFKRDAVPGRSLLSRVLGRSLLNNGIFDTLLFFSLLKSCKMMIWEQQQQHDDALDRAMAESLAAHYAAEQRQPPKPATNKRKVGPVSSSVMPRRDFVALERILEGRETQPSKLSSDFLMSLPASPGSAGSGDKTPEDCVICTGPLNNTTFVTTLTCAHTFCNACIIHALCVKNECPVCRLPVPLHEEGSRGKKKAKNNKRHKRQ